MVAHQGLRAHLALRAGDIVDLRLIDADWDRAVIHVSGKSRRETALPLPQDVGDALCTYITTVRPRVDEPRLDEQKVFLGVRAPHRPFSNPGVVTKIARRTLDRAGVITFASRGAHVFRHYIDGLTMSRNPARFWFCRQVSTLMAT